MEYLGDIPTEYLSVELKTKPLDTPDEPVRLAVGEEYETGQVRILRAAAPKDPATWLPAAKGITFGPGRYIRIELKTGPVR